MVFTGGDPLKRPDLFLLLQHSAALGLRTNVSPGITPLLTRGVIRQFKDCGVARMAIRLDGDDALSHDDLGGVPEAFGLVMAALEEARSIGLDTQVQTIVTRRNTHRLDAIAGLVEQIKARTWSVFSPVATGRLPAGDDLTAEEYEQVFGKLHEISQAASFDVRTTRTVGGSDARGSVLVSHTGEIYPSGFLRISAGNVRMDSLVSVYRNSALFRELRRHGKSGDYESRKLCRGLRARAVALTAGLPGGRSETHLPADV